MNHVYYELSQYLNTNVDENGDVNLGLHCGLLPEHIERMYIIGSNEWFVIKYVDVDVLEAVPSHLIKVQYPALVVKFFDQMLATLRETHEIDCLIIR